MKLSVTQLAEMTGFDRRTVKARLDEIDPEIKGTAHLYDSRKALPAIYGFDGGGTQTRLDPAQERAMLDRERRLAAELSRLQQERELIHISDVTEEWVNQIAIAKSRFLALPSRLGPDLVSMKNQRVIEDKLRNSITEILTELAGDVSSTSVAA